MIMGAQHVIIFKYFRAYFLQNTSVLLRATCLPLYTLPIYIQVFCSTCTSNSLSINLYVTLVLYITLCMPVCNLYTTHSVRIYYLCPTHLRLISCISPRCPRPQTPQVAGATTYTGQIPHTNDKYAYLFHVCVHMYVLYCIVLYCIVLYCIVLYCNVM